MLEKVEMHAHSVALHFMHYTFVKIHSTPRTTPAQAAGVTDRLWAVEDLVGLLPLERHEGRVTSVASSDR
ncbi:MAG: hypothetical protein CL477_05775 [Acidobacteria bacterium]|jgi:hypothetical protein|nr:hypothetical protein [Acidobacteriota bacterium]|tara:strand:+ start:411 stop:620 length:210 start_codon:yes stop_codon:yes gene_type:complete